MPLKSAELMQVLDQKRSEFTDFSSQSRQVYQDYRRALQKVSTKTDDEITELLSDYDHPGARPLEALGTSKNWQIPSGLQWVNREHSLEWVRERLTGVTTFAVDGSQVFPSKEVSPPVALVQVGWFQNAHSSTGSYQKDIRLTVMTPTELQIQRNGRPLDRQVSMRRFQMEVERIIEFMESHPSCDDCLVFFDGSLVVTFAEAFDLECKAFYAEQMVNLLRASEQYRVPVVGYIDTSQACDVLQMLQCLEVLPETTLLNDAQLLGVGMNWGDRTPIFSCARPGDAWGQGILGQYEEQRDAIAFLYMKANGNMPVRLEFPRWIVDDGKFANILDYIRGEIIIGGGYPYVIETADQVAVLQADDRRLFYQLLQDWSEKAALKMRFSRKMVSKQLRRR
ncbi:MAG: DNA double-strand break repair nuclease NurA [Thermosynechococcaceae cyanobacterium]